MLLYVRTIVFWGSVFGPCFVMHYLVFLRFFFNRLDEEDRADCFALIVFLMSCDCWCSVALPHGVVGWSAVRDCGIS